MLPLRPKTLLTPPATLCGCHCETPEFHTSAWPLAGAVEDTARFCMAATVVDARSPVTSPAAVCECVIAALPFNCVCRSDVTFATYPNAVLPTVPAPILLTLIPVATCESVTVPEIC